MLLLVKGVYKMSNSSSSSSGIGVIGLLGVLFIGLKLCHVIDWSWWWVLAPFWMGTALVLFILLCFVLGWVCYQLYIIYKAKRQRSIDAVVRKVIAQNLEDMK